MGSAHFDLEGSSADSENDTPSQGSLVASDHTLASGYSLCCHDNCIMVIALDEQITKILANKAQRPRNLRLSMSYNILRA